MNTAQVEALRTLLASSGWVERTDQFARRLRGWSKTAQGLLVVGTPAFEPWHMAAHLADEMRLLRHGAAAGEVARRWEEVG